MASNVTAIMTAMTDGERPWTQEALNSILAQTLLPDAVVVLVELANTWIEAEIQALPHRALAERLVRVHRIPMARLGAVRNAGVQRAATKWVAYLDGDDVWRQARLERQLEAAARHPAASFIGGDFVFIDAKSRPFAFANGSNPTPSSWLVDRELMLRHPFDPELPMGEDYYWLKATRAESERVRVPEVLVGYRIRGLSLSSLHYGHSRQRRVREAMARASRFAFVRYPMLCASYARYWMNRGRGYAV
jgi:glycosyltransferase involved in cell wall biosynthesis